MTADRPLRIAHAHGNHPEKLERALAGPVDLVETDIWFRDGTLWVRHERRLGWLPWLIDHRRNAFGARLPGDIRLWRWYLRRDARMPLETLIRALGGRKGLVLDIKGAYSPAKESALARFIAGLLREHDLVKRTIICGQNWRALDAIRRTAPELDVRDTVGKRRQWPLFLARLQRGQTPAAIAINYRLLQAQEAQTLLEKDVSFICWTVDELPEAIHILQFHPDGITSNNLELLGALDNVTA